MFSIAFFCVDAWLFELELRSWHVRRELIGEVQGRREARGTYNDDQKALPFLLQ